MNKKSGGTSGRRSAGGNGHGHGGVHPSDLRKKLLKTVQEKAVKARSGSASASRAVSPTGSDDEHRDKEVRESNKKQEGQSSGSPTPKRKKNNRAKEAPVAHIVESEEWVKLMPVELGLSKEETKDGEGMEIDPQDAVKKLADHGIVGDKPFFTNTTFYSLLRLLHVSQSSH